MSVSTHTISIRTNGNTDIKNITDEVADCLRESNLQNGILTVFIGGSTGGITTIEYEPGLLKDFPETMETVAPAGKTYHHNETWHDGNGHSHIRSSLVGTSYTVPFSDGKMLLGTWQQIIFIDFDNRSRRRQIIVQIIGE
jgi:secondary thiamine-phosphate synthase enzyme